MPSISLCMIVKNEERNLPRCLDSVQDLVDEIVIVDTGSSDATGRQPCAIRTGYTTSPGGTTLPLPAILPLTRGRWTI